MTEEQQIEAGIAALEAQRGLLGDSVVHAAAAPLRARLDTLRAAQGAAAQQATVMCVDTVGSTAMAQRLHPEDVHAVLDGALQRFTQIVQAHRGRVLQYTGDGLIASFGADDAEAATRAGLAIVAEAGRLSAQAQREHHVDGFNVRVGLATGPLRPGGLDADGSVCRSSALHGAAHMEQTAPPGGLRLHHGTYGRLRGGFDASEDLLPPLPGSDMPLLTYLVHAAHAAHDGAKTL